METRVEQDLGLYERLTEEERSLLCSTLNRYAQLGPYITNDNLAHVKLGAARDALETAQNRDDLSPAGLRVARSILGWLNAELGTDA